MTYRLVHLLAGSALLFAVGAAGAAVSMDDAAPATQGGTGAVVVLLARR